MDHDDQEKIALKNIQVIRNGLFLRENEMKNFEDYIACCVQVLAPSVHFYKCRYLLMSKAAISGWHSVYSVPSNLTVIREKYAAIREKI